MSKNNEPKTPEAPPAKTLEAPPEAPKAKRDAPKAKREGFRYHQNTAYVLADRACTTGRGIRAPGDAIAETDFSVNGAGIMSALAESGRLALAPTKD